MRLRAPSIRRHLPAIATFLVIAWLAAVYAYSVSGTPAAARKMSSKRLFTTALGGRAPKVRYEERSEPIDVDVRFTPTPKKTKRKPTGERRERTVKEEPKKEKTTASARDVGHSLPVSSSLASTSQLRSPHHDYPALDIPLDSGTNVYAVTTGRITDTTSWGACGKGVIIRGRDGFTYTYCHGTRRMVGRGRFVRAGDRILKSGNTGDSTGPHLHLQIHNPYGNLVCPQHILPAWANGHAKSPWKAGRHGCFTGAHKHKHGKKRR